MGSVTPPIFAFEVKYFRDILRISYECGRRMRVRGILTPDAYMSDGRPLYLTDPESIRQAKERISTYRARVARTRHNLAPLCPKKAVTV